MSHWLSTLQLLVVGLRTELFFFFFLNGKWEEGEYETIKENFRASYLTSLFFYVEKNVHQNGIPSFLFLTQKLWISDTAVSWPKYKEVKTPESPEENVLHLLDILKSILPVKRTEPCITQSYMSVPQYTRADEGHTGSYWLKYIIGG